MYDYRRFGVLSGSASDVRFLNAPKLNGAIHVNRAITTPEVSDATNPVVVTATLRGSVAYNPPGLADGVGITTTATVTGAALGDAAPAAFGMSLAGVSVTAWVSATDTVSVRFQNETGNAVDLVSDTLYAFVTKG